MSRTEIMVGGVGGQGVVLSGILLGTAATLFENKKAVQTQSYSSELRGGVGKGGSDYFRASRFPILRSEGRIF